VPPLHAPTIATPSPDGNLSEPDADELSVDETALLTAASVGEVLPFRDPAGSPVPPRRTPLEPSP
jgi:hypothetical protein